jgi:hypothetical protein
LLWWSGDDGVQVGNQVQREHVGCERCGCRCTGMVYKNVINVNNL